MIVAASALVGLGLQWLCLRVPHGWLLLGLLMSSLLAQRGLYEHVAAVAAGPWRRAGAGPRGGRAHRRPRPRAARRAGGGARRDRIHRREFLRRRGGAAALGRAARPARHARLQGDQHRRQHDRPSLAALRGFRAFCGAPRRRRELAAGAPRGAADPRRRCLAAAPRPRAGWRAHAARRGAPSLAQCRLAGGGDGRLARPAPRRPAPLWRAAGRRCLDGRRHAAGDAGRHPSRAGTSWSAPAIAAAALLLALALALAGFSAQPARPAPAALRHRPQPRDGRRARRASASICCS